MYTVRVNLDGLRSTDTLVYRTTITTTEIGNANSRESRRAFGFAVEVVEFRHPSRRPPETFDGALRPPFLMSCDSSNLINELKKKKKKGDALELVRGQRALERSIRTRKLDTFHCSLLKFHGKSVGSGGRTISTFLRVLFLFARICIKKLGTR